MSRHTLRTVGVLGSLALCLVLITAPLWSADAPVKTPGIPPALPGTTKPAAPPSIKPEPKTEAKEVELDAELDLAKLLNRTLVFPPSTAVSDGIWTITPSELNRMVMRVPLKIAKPSAPVMVSGAKIKVVGGRFICWQLIDPTEETTGGAATAAGAIEAVGTDKLPTGVPRMTRAVVISPDGTISWKLDRSIGGAKLPEITAGGTASSPYVYKLSPTAVEKLSPGNPPRTVKNVGEAPAEFIKRKQQADEEYKKKKAVYDDAKQVTRKLPDDFKGPMPQTLWAVYETRAGAKNIELDDWEFPVDLLFQLQKLMGATGGDTTGALAVSTPIDQQVLKLLEAQKVHPYTLRIVAHAITGSNFLEKMEENDAKYKLVEGLLGGKDSVTTAELMKYLAVRPTKASLALQAKAIKDGLLDAKAQMSSFLGTIDAVKKDPNTSVDGAVQGLNRYLADPKGPPPREMLAQLVELTKTRNNGDEMIVKSLRIEAPAGPRRDEVIIALLEMATSDPLGMAVLDQRVLGAEDATLAERALYLLSRTVRPKFTLPTADYAGKAISFSPQTKLIVVDFWANATVKDPNYLAKLHKEFSPQGVSFLGVCLEKDRATLELAVKEMGYDWPQLWDGKQMATAQAVEISLQSAPTVLLVAPTGDVLWRGQHAKLAEAMDTILAGGVKLPPAPSAADTDPRPALAGDVLIYDTQHSIFRLLGDAKLRNLAWAAMPYMAMYPADKIKSPSIDRPKWPFVVVDSAVSTTPAPVAAVRFLAKHDDPNVYQAIAQLVYRTEGDASIAASKALLGSGYPLDQVIAKFTNENDRHSFGIRYYENIYVEAPYTVGLLRDKAESSKVVQWFGKSISAGVLPEPAKWVKAYGGADRLLELVNVSDEQLGMGAIGTLVAAAGGRPDDIPAIASKLRANKNASIPELVKIWQNARKEIFIAKLKSAGGDYDLTLRIGEAPKGGDLKWGRSQTVGTVTMKVEGATIGLNKVAASLAADDSGSIVIKAGDVKNLIAAPQLASIKVDGNDKPIAMTPLGASAWYADFSDADSRRIEITLTLKK